MTARDPRLIRPIAVLVVAAVCVAALVGLVLRENHARSHGTRVTLSMRGADPRDLVRGHYVQIQVADQLPAGRACVQKDDGWIAVTSGGGPTDQPVGIYDTKDEALRNGDHALRGSMRCTGPGRTDDGGPATAWLDIGTDRFYINQRDAQDIDRALASGRRAAAIVSVGTDGRARLVGLDVDGKRYDLHW
ncbi:GDYXXLXY domain-containing protein [Gordonia sp. (in: high G+C Gram-positive bacteria)]|uniref:GDYXXLXY domain-containing protein n=1 Tax=Gordonia sp. (in: high G+C Gram-positive bacteria) TaxID=84139 RepID=UPI0039E4E0BE